MDDVKILFLDVDGVLNYIGCDERLSDQHLARLRKIVEKTKCKIIISSTYKLSNQTMKFLWDNLENHGIQKKLYTIEKFSYTPDLIDFGCNRTEEITSTINDIKNNYNDKYKIISWIAIDDGDLSLSSQNFIKIDPNIGLSDDDVTNIINILNK